MRKARRHYALEEKVAILRRHLLEKESVSSCRIRAERVVPALLAHARPN